MSMNKYMHPRNNYKNPPNFKELALMYPDFGRIVNLDISGKVKLDFKNIEVLRELTKCLLKNDFQLDVQLPPDKLVPTLSLRLNYILWIEDLIDQCGFIDITGIDIGCGASCIYPLLAARKNNWKMIALESNSDSCSVAIQNTEMNNLQDQIEIIHQPDTNVIFPKISKPTHFCMCNPPFYTSLDDIDPSNKLKNRTGTRSEPNNAPSGCADEIATDGGECEFVKKIIDESIQLMDRVKIYTTMLGHKKSLPIVLQHLAINSITNVTQTEFCQGHTTRWGVAWSFDPFVYLRLVPSYGPNVIQHKIFSFIIPKVSEVSDGLEEIERIFGEIDIGLKQLKWVNRNSVKAKIIVYENTWSNQRRKRRQMKQHVPVKQNNINKQIEDEINIKRPLEVDEDEQCSRKRVKVNGTESVECVRNAPILVVALNVRLTKERLVQFEMMYLSGSAKLDGVYQLFQYVVNRFKMKK